MLDVMRQHSRSFVIYVFFGIIISVFVINFGPQSGGCAPAVSNAGKIGGRQLSLKIFNFYFNYMLQSAGYRGEHLPEDKLIQARGDVMDLYVVRELLANDALKLGFRVSDQEIEDMLVNRGLFYSLGKPSQLPRSESGKFDYDLFSRWVRYNWQITVANFKEEQERELLAEKLRGTLLASVKVSEDEVFSDYMQKGNQAQLEYARFSPFEYRSRVAVTPEQVKAFLSTDKKKVEKHFTDNKAAYQKLPKQINLQALQISYSGEGQLEEAKQKAATLLKSLQAGVALQQVAQDAQKKQLVAPSALRTIKGWRNETTVGLGETASQTVTKLAVGQWSEIIVDKDAVTIARIQGRREGDLKLEQVQDEIAEELLLDEEAQKLAKSDAESFSKRAAAGEKLSDMFTLDDETARPDIEALLAQSGGKIDEKMKEALRKIQAEADAKKKAEQEAKAAQEPESGKSNRSPIKLLTTTFFSRSGRYLVPGIGISQSLMNAVFKMKTGEVAKEPMEVGKVYYLFAVKERKEANQADWAKQKDTLVDEFLKRKQANVVMDYYLNRCLEGVKEKQFQVNSNVMITPGYQPEKGAEPLPGYTPCRSLQQRAL